jgi:hypothetical protein
VIREELSRLLSYEERHRRLFARQLLTVSSQLPNPLSAAGRVVDIGLELWAVIVVAGSAGALASFFQSADASNGSSSSGT